jgi:hypothetical protein
MEPNTGKSLMRTCFRVQTIKDWGKDFTFQQDNDPKLTVKAMLEWLQNKNVSLSDPSKAQT